MKLALFQLALNVLLLLPLTEAWTLVWRNASDSSFVEHSKTSMPCTKISNAKGRLFEYDSEEGPFEISLYGNSDCSGTASGWASHLLSKNASAAINSFKVDSTATTSMTMTTSSTSTQSKTSTSMTTTETSSAASGSESDLSGGAIAGIVIGVVVGVAIIGAILFFIGQRRRALSKEPVTTGSTSTTMGYAPSGHGSPDTYTSPSSFGQRITALDTEKQILGPSSAQGSSGSPVRVVELPGDYNPAELGNSNTRVEMEGQVRSPTSPS